MKVNLYRNNNAKVAILNAIGNNVDLTKQFIDARNPELRDENGEPLDEIVFTINGVELDFNEFVNSFAEQWNSVVEKRALEIVQEKYEALLYPVHEILEEIEHQKNKFCGYIED